MTHAETRLGLTPITKRLAYHFMCRGVGPYELVDHPQYDRAVVSEFDAWNAPEGSEDCSGGLRVTFFKDGERIRYVEFRVAFAGGGGREEIRRIK